MALVTRPDRATISRYFPDNSWIEANRSQIPSLMEEICFAAIRWSWFGALTVVGNPCWPAPRKLVQPDPNIRAGLVFGGQATPTSKLNKNELLLLLGLTVQSQSDKTFSVYVEDDSFADHADQLLQEFHDLLLEECAPAFDTRSQEFMARPVRGPSSDRGLAAALQHRQAAQRPRLQATGAGDYSAPPARSGLRC